MTIHRLGIDNIGTSRVAHLGMMGMLHKELLRVLVLEVFSIVSNIREGSTAHHCVFLGTLVHDWLWMPVGGRFDIVDFVTVVLVEFL